MTILTDDVIMTSSFNISLLHNKTFFKTKTKTKMLYIIVTTTKTIYN